MILAPLKAWAHRHTRELLVDMGTVTAHLVVPTETEHMQTPKPAVWYRNRSRQTPKRSQRSLLPAATSNTLCNEATSRSVNRQMNHDRTSLSDGSRGKQIPLSTWTISETLYRKSNFQNRTNRIISSGVQTRKMHRRGSTDTCKHT